MFARRISIALATSALLAGAAQAQSTWVEIEDDALQVPEFSASVDQAEDWDVYAGGAKVGEVEEVLGTKPGAPTAFAVDFDDDAGFGDRDVVIPFDQFTWENNQLVLDADAAAVGDMDVWDD